MGRLSYSAAINSVRRAALMKLLKWALGQVAAYWISVLLAAVAAALGITALIAKQWVAGMFMLSSLPVEVPRYIFLAVASSDGQWSLLCCMCPSQGTTSDGSKLIPERHR